MKYFIWTEGCQMNVVDSQHTASALEKIGYDRSQKAEDADVIVLNTCVVRQSAEDKAYGRLQSLKPLKNTNPDLVINVMGCLIGFKGDKEFQEKYSYVDVFSPPSDPRPLINHLIGREANKINQSLAENQNSILDEDFSLPIHLRNNLVSTYISIVLGCSHACSYCVIPYRRGAEESRPPELIIKEAESLVEQGIKEITLLGQIVDRYGVDKPDYPSLAKLLKMIHEIDELERIRFLTSHPNYMTDELLNTVAELPKVMPHIEVPIQSGDDIVLGNMRRGYTVKKYIDLIEKIRAIVPGVSIGTDIIVGFPGESEHQFNNTYNLLKDLKLDVAHLARYSPRPNTLSTRTMPDDVPEPEKWDRFRALEELQKGIVEKINQQYLRNCVDVLFEVKNKNRWRGRTPTNRLVFVENDLDLRGKLLPVKIKWAGPWSLIGDLK